MRRLFIHIGPHKTGTSFLQSCLLRSRSALAEKGVLYPASGLKDWRAHHGLAFAMKGQVHKGGGQGETLSLEDEVAWIASEMASSDSPTIILSSEEFFSVPSASIALLREQFSDMEIKAIFYARRQDELFVSSYAQHIKMPHAKLDKPMHELIKSPRRVSQDLDMYQCVSNWAKVLGRENIVARLYDKQSDILKDFLAILDVEDDLISPSRAKKKVNVSASLEATEVMRHVKMVCDDNDIRRKSYHLLSDLYAGGRKVDSGLSSADRLEILNLYRESNEKLFSDYWGEANLFSPELLLSDHAMERSHMRPDEARYMASKIVTLYRNTGPLNEELAIRLFRFWFRMRGLVRA